MAGTKRTGTDKGKWISTPVWGLSEIPEDEKSKIETGF